MKEEIKINSKIIHSILVNKKYDNFIFIEETLKRKPAYYTDKKIIIKRLTDDKYFCIKAGFTTANNVLCDYKPTAIEVKKKINITFV